MGQARGDTQGGSGGDANEASLAGRDARPLKTSPKTSRNTRKTAKTLRPMVVVEAGRKVLRVGGVIQSVHVDEGYEPDVWDAMLPRERPQSALILGLGGGTMAQL